MQTKGVRGQKIPKNANVICERPLITDYRCDSAEFSCNTDRFVYVAGFYSQLASRVTHARSVQAVVYLGRHVVLFEYFCVIVHS